MADDDNTTSGVTESGLAAARIRVVAAWGASSATLWVPRGKSVRIGRGAECDLRIDHPSVSRTHARVHGSEPVEVEDLGSSNGTRVGKRLLSTGERAAIGRHDVVEVGSAVLFIRSPAPATEREPLAPSNWRHVLDIVAKSPLMVLLLGETGVGKNVAADRIHQLSARAKQPLIRLNCAAVPELLLESELFGHEQGAFTGAVQAKQGLLEAANGGTLLLDEIGEMSLSTQAKLLHVLENGELTRLGSVRARRVDFRLLSATNRDLEQLVRQGVFRADLYYRINGVSVRVPPLRERVSEIVPFAEQFLAAACVRAGRSPLRLTDAAAEALEAHPWPGNIRELRNGMERAAVLATGDAITPLDLPKPPPAAIASDNARPLAEQLNGLERTRIAEALAQCAGNQSRAAKLLGMPRRTFVLRLEQYGLRRAPAR